MFLLRLGGRCLGLLRLAEPRLQRVDIAFDVFQPIALRQPHRRRLGGLGANDQPIPAPQVALLRHQSCADRQPALQAVAVLRRGDEADGRQAQAQGVGRLDVRRQGFDTQRTQVDVRRLRFEVLGPEGQGLRLRALRQRQVEVVAQGGGQGQFVALFRLDLIEHGRTIGLAARLAAAGQDLRQAAGLGRHAAQAVFGFARRLARLGLGIDQRYAIAFQGVGRLARRFHVGLGFGRFGLEAVERGIVEAAQHLAVAVGGGQLRAQPIEARLGFLQPRRFQALALGLRGLFGRQDFDGAVGRDTRLFGGGQGGAQFRFARWGFVDLGLDTGEGGLQPFDLDRAVGRQVAFAFEIGAQALQVGLQPFDLAGRLLFLQVEPLLLDAEAVHHGRGDLFLLAQRGNGLVGGQGRGLGRRSGAPGLLDAGGLRLHVGSGGFELGAGLQPAGVDDRLLQGSDLG